MVRSANPAPAPGTDPVVAQASNLTIRTQSEVELMPSSAMGARIEEVKNLRAQAVAKDYIPSLRVLPKSQKIYSSDELPTLVKSAQRQYGKLLEQLKLPEADATALLTLIAERMLQVRMALADYPLPQNAQITLQPTIDPVTDIVRQRIVQIDIIDPQFMAGINAAADAQVNPRIKDLLGDNFQTYENYQNSLPLRQLLVGSFARALREDASLNPDQKQLSGSQTDQLTALAGREIPSYNISTITINERVVAGAKEILSPDQQAVFEKFSAANNRDSAAVQRAIQEYAASLAR